MPERDIEQTDCGTEQWGGWQDICHGGSTSGLTIISMRPIKAMLDVTKKGPFRGERIGPCLFLAEDQYETELA